LNLALCKDLASFVVLPDDNSNEFYKTGDKFEVQESYDYQIMKNTGCLATIGYAFRRGGQASSLANLGIQKAYPLYIFCWQIVLEPTFPLPSCLLSRAKHIFSPCFLGNNSLLLFKIFWYTKYVIKILI